MFLKSKKNPQCCIVPHLRKTQKEGSKRKKKRRSPSQRSERSLLNETKLKVLISLLYFDCFKLNG